MAMLDRDGVGIFYEALGDGPTVLLTHGYSASARMWRPRMSRTSPAEGRALGASRTCMRVWKRYRPKILGLGPILRVGGLPSGG